jgi:DNA end-binding protein Ku
MARAFWKGSISFGLVEIPVNLKPAVQSQDLSFSLLDRKDFSPVGYKR